MSITVVGLGLKRADLTQEAIEALRKATRVVLRTGACEAVEWLRENFIKFETFDDMYSDYDDFTVLYDDMAGRIIEMSESDDVAYGVFDLRDESVERLSHLDYVKLVPGPPIDGELTAFCAGPVVMTAACDIGSFQPRAGMGVVVREIDSRLAASEVKIRLLQKYPYDCAVVMVSDGKIMYVKLDELDRLDEYNHTVAAYIPGERNFKRLPSFSVDELCEVARNAPNERMALDSLRGKMSELNDKADDFDMTRALGGILSEITLICESARRRGRFSLDDVISEACENLINRPYMSRNSQ